jgi:hypothetical protein
VVDVRKYVSGENNGRKVDAGARRRAAVALGLAVAAALMRVGDFTRALEFESTEFF